MEKEEAKLASSGAIDLLVMVIVSGEQVGKLSQELVQHQFYFTRVEGAGGLIPDSFVSLLVGIESSRKPALTRLIQRCCKPQSRYIPTGLESVMIQTHPVMIEAQVGGALVYMLEVEHFERF